MYSTFIGLEIHVHLSTQSKIFCACPARFGDPPNTNVCPVCMGYPGTLPVLNERAIEFAYIVARALRCDLEPVAVFERKNYFYPDLPKNYQISQFAHPVGRNGSVTFAVNGEPRQVRIHECHLEEDAGKMIHAGDVSLLDFNRTGTPLLEIVTEPDLSQPEDAEALLHELRRIVRHLGVSDGNMEEGSLRCDANVSINLPGHGLGRKVEIKNMNSSRFVRKALTYEIERQATLLDASRTIVQETRLWNENRDQTESMRSKENANDYRYFPEPDLPPFVTDAAFLAAVESQQVELPQERKRRYLAQMNLSVVQADFLVEERYTADFFDQAVERGCDPQIAAAWLAADVQRLLNRNNQSLRQSPLSVDRFVRLLELLTTGTIHGKLAKQVLSAVFEQDSDPDALIAANGWTAINDEAAVQTVVDAVLAQHSSAAAEFFAGDSKVLGFLIGQAMRRSGGTVDPAAVRRHFESAAPREQK